LPVDYFHVVFTLPGPVASLAHAHPRLIYELLFTAAAATLRQVAADPRHLGARVGVLAVLHTWGQNLHLHPHLHCVVTGGGLSLDGTAWIHSTRPGNNRRRKKYLLPVKVLSAVFRGKFLAGLRAARDRGELPLTGSLAKWQRPECFAQLLRGLYRRSWVVYAKPPFGGPEQVLKYLARYTHRVAISNQRILEVANGKVTFRWKDYHDESRQKKLTLPATEFLRRFLQHVLPKGFVRIRQYGLLANRNRAAQLATCRRLLGVLPPALDPTGLDATLGSDPPVAAAEPALQCPHCRGTAWRRTELGPRPSLWRLAHTYWRCDSS
jgi:Putative transposase